MTEIGSTPPDGAEHVSESKEGALLENTVFFDRQGELMRDKGFLVEVAEACNDAYAQTERDKLTQAGQEIPGWLQEPLFSVAEHTALLQGAQAVDKGTYDRAQAKLATNLAGLYALSEGLGMAVDEDPTNPTQAHDTLRTIVAGKADAGLSGRMSRLVHATWAAGQPFRDRETRGVMQPFDTLSQDERLKDMVQIKASAQVLNTRI